MRVVVSVVTLLASAAILAGQQSLPSAPEPKPAPTPFKLPAQATPVPPPESKPADSKPKDTTGKNVALFDFSGVFTRPLEDRQQLLLADYIAHRLKPAVFARWAILMPEEAMSRQRRFHLNRKGKTGKVAVSFTLHKDGSITDAAVSDSSGDKVLDQAALQAIRESKPGPLPAGFERETQEMRFKFAYNP
jgi:protein TonB